jgi:hypothetical protein
MISRSHFMPGLFSNISGTPDIFCTDETSVMALRACNLGVGGGQDQRIVPKDSRILERPRSCLKTVLHNVSLNRGLARNTIQSMGNGLAESISRSSLQ